MIDSYAKTMFIEFTKKLEEKGFTPEDIEQVRQNINNEWSKEYVNFLQGRDVLSRIWGGCKACKNSLTAEMENLYEIVEEERLAGATEGQKHRCKHYCRECALELIFDIIVNQELPLRQFGGISARGEEEWN